jgi:hypothetical protein
LPAPISIEPQSPPVGAPQVHAAHVRASVNPVNQALCRRPAGQVRAPSNRTHAPAATTGLGTHTWPAAQPPPTAGTAQNLVVEPQVGVPLVGVPLGAHVPVAAPVKTLARIP